MSAAGGAGAPAAAVPQPAPILQLPEAVVHRIAAGEVIQRPASALKEMVENSMDAGATRISVTVKEGGLRLLQVSDDGCGITRGDLPLLCVRHATSKLRAYEDLETIATLGFRGEALASISFVAHLSVTTMTRGGQHGWRATYQDGVLLDPPGAKPCAAVPGTVLTVEDLFYNVPARRKAFRAGGAEEGALVLDLLQRYSIWAAPRVGFSLRRQGEPRADLSTSPGASRLDVIRQLHGPDLAGALLPISVAKGNDPGPELAHDAPGGPHLRVEGYVTGLAWTGRRGALVLFINGRCVECGALKRGAEAVYASLMPRAPKPWMFLDVKLPPRQVEVNVHPTKREVGFLHQDEVIDAICHELESTLLAAMSSRTFATQAPPSAAATGMKLAEQLAQQFSQKQRQAAQQSQQQEKQQTQQPPAYRPDKLVRADHRMRTMDAFVVRGAGGFGSQGQQQRGERGATSGDGSGDVEMGEPLPAGQKQQQQQQGISASVAARAAVAGGVPRKRRAADRDRLAFNSSMVAAAAAAAADEQQQQVGGDDLGELVVPDATQPSGHQQQRAVVRQRVNPPGPPPNAAARQLLAARESSCHPGLSALIREHVFVGLADEMGEWALLQHDTRLYLLACGALSRDLFELQLLRRWGRCQSVGLGETLGLRQVAEAGLELEAAAGRWKHSDGPIPELASLTASVLTKQAPLLAQAGLLVDGQGQLTALPILLDGYTPDLARLPELVLGLVRDVPWESTREVEVVEAVAGALAAFFALQPLQSEAPAVVVAAGDKSNSVVAAAAVAGSTAVAGDQGGREGAMEVDGGYDNGRRQGGGPASDPESAGLRDGSDTCKAADSQQQKAQPSAVDSALAPYRLLQEREWLCRHVLFSAMKSMLLAPACRARDGSCLLLTSMERLYRVFERCG